MRKKTISYAERVVVKIGTSLLVDTAGRIKGRSLAGFAAQIHDLMDRGKEIVVVTSGAIGIGLRRMGIEQRPQSMPLLQAAAAVGQNILMNAYQKAFTKFSIVSAQVLLTHDGLKDRTRFLNARHTIRTLLTRGIVPVINENDTVAIDEMKIGDNDTLSALVTTVVEADLLILLSDIDGFMTGDPKKEKNTRIISEVQEITPEIRKMARPVSGGFGVGGLVTKLNAAEIVTRSGEGFLIVNGKTTNILTRLFDGEELGTFFHPQSEKLQGRKRWLAFNRRIQSHVTVDSGAVRALIKKHSSLLPIGIKACEGKFSRGDTIMIRDESGNEIARGIANYSSAEVDKIKGMKSSRIASILGYQDYDEIIHRDNLVIMNSGDTQ